MTNPEFGMPVDIVMPALLDGARGFAATLDGLDEHSDPADLVRISHRLATELDRCAEYGQRLWHQLQVIATYLREDVAHADTSEVNGVLTGDDARRHWGEAYGSTLSLLAGPRGDSGYGEQQAQLELQNLDTPSPLR